jgi:hypothetical protein
VTTTDGRAVLDSQYTMRPTAITNSTPWLWPEYYKFLSFKGLYEANCFESDFPKDSDQLYLLSKYIEYGHKELNP